MRPKKTKKIKRALERLQHTFLFRRPFQLLLDEKTMAFLDKTRFQMTVINKAFHYPKLFTSRCLYRKYRAALQANEIENGQDALLSSGSEKTSNRGEMAKHVEIRECLHKEPVDAYECLRKFVRSSNKNHYFMCCSLPDMDRYRALSKVPIVVFKHNSTVLLDLSNFDVRN